MADTCNPELSHLLQWALNSSDSFYIMFHIIYMIMKRDMSATIRI